MKGAIKNPPNIKPASASQSVILTNKNNDAADAKLIKNSVAFTVPITFLGSILLLSKVVVTTGPQPPPPAASTNPPVAARGIIFEIFCLKFILIFLKALMSKNIPINNK